MEKKENNDIESEYYYALGHDLRRKMIKFIGINEFSSFTQLKKELKVSTGTIYHHLETLSQLIEQNEEKKYYLTELGLHAFDSLSNNKKVIESPRSRFQLINIPLIRELSSGIIFIINSYNKNKKIYLVSLSIFFLIIGFIFCELNKFYSILFFFRNIEAIDLPILYGTSYILNYLVFFLIIEGIVRLFFKNRENSLILLIIFPIILIPINIYQILTFFLNFLGGDNIPMIYFIDRIFLIFFQAFSIYLLSYILNIVKGLKIENGLIISLLIHLTGFSIILFFIL